MRIRRMCMCRLLHGRESGELQAMDDGLQLTPRTMAKFVNAGSAKNNATNQPVQTVDWYDCVKWCNARSQQAGLTPVYYTDAGFTQVYTNGAWHEGLSGSGDERVSVADGSGVGEGGAGRVGGQPFSVGQQHFGKPGQLLRPTAGNSYDLCPSGYNAIGCRERLRPRVRWGRLHRTRMGYTTWLGMLTSGVGTGMQLRRIRLAVRIWEGPIRQERG